MRIIKLPWIRLFALLPIAAFIAYWCFAIRPYHWIADAHVALLTTPISSDLSGRIAQIGPDAGDTVQKGELLFAFDTAPLLSRQQQLRAQLASLNNQLHAEQLQMNQTMQQYLETPYQDLFATFEEAQANAEALSQNIASLQTEYDTLEVQMHKLAIRAPFSGIILHRTAHAGAVIAFGQTIYTLCDPSRIWIEANVPETLLSRLVLNAPIRIQLSAFPKKEWLGSLSWIGPAAQSTMIPIKVSVDDPTFPRRLGLSAKIALR